MSITRFRGAGRVQGTRPTGHACSNLMILDSSAALNIWLGIPSFPPSSIDDMCVDSLSGLADRFLSAVTRCDAIDYASNNIFSQAAPPSNRNTDSEQGPGHRSMPPRQSYSQSRSPSILSRYSQSFPTK